MKKHRPPPPSRGRRWFVQLLISVLVLITTILGAFVAANWGVGFGCGFKPGRAKAGRAKAGTDIFAICSALDAYAAQHDGRYPRTLNVLVLPDKDGRTLLKNQTQIPPDPWGTPYSYEPPSEVGGLLLVTSLGRDGQPGGDGLDADIDNFTIRNRSR